jgi:hypothetical protein
MTFKLHSRSAFISALILTFTFYPCSPGFGCYPQFSPEHYGCVTGTQCRGHLPVGVGKGEQDLIVKLHNEVRAQVAAGTSFITLKHRGSVNRIQLNFFAPSASNMGELVSAGDVNSLNCGTVD